MNNENTTLDFWIKEKYFYTLFNCLDLGKNNTDADIQYIGKERLKYIKRGNFYLFCFNYALKNPRLMYVETSIEYITKYYRNILLTEIQKNDIVVFRDDFDYLHFAKIMKVDKEIDNIVVRSKFGRLGIYEHKLNDTPTIYGNIVSFWRKNIFKITLTNRK